MRIYFFPGENSVKDLKSSIKNGYGRKFCIYQTLDFLLYINSVMPMAHFVNVEQKINCTLPFFLTCFDMCTCIWNDKIVCAVLDTFHGLRTQRR